MPTNQYSLTNSLIDNIKELFFFHLNRRRQIQFGLLLVLMILASLAEMIGLGAIFPFLSALNNPENLLSHPQLQTLWNFLQIETSGELIRILAVSFMVAVLISNGIRVFTLNIQLNFSAVLSSELANQIFTRTLRQPYSFHLKHNSSDLMQTVTGDTNIILTQIMFPLITLINQLFLIPALIITLVLIDAKITCILTLLIGGAYWIIYIARNNLLSKNSRVIVEASQQKIKMVQESLGGIRDISINNSYDFFERNYFQSESHFRKAQVKNELIAMSPSYFMEALTLCLIAFVSLSLGNEGNFSQVIPILGSIALGAKKLLPSLQQVFSNIANIQGSQSSLIRVLVALRRPVNPLTLNTNVNSLSVRDSIKLDHIWFRYGENSEWVLRDLSLEIKAKTTVAFIGSTGSGKSTTADLILGLLQPQKGAILIDNIPLERENLFQWKQNIAHVPQSIFLSDGSISQNIAFAVPYDKIDMERVKRAANLAQIDKFIESLPAQYETYVGERGIRLSGGQRQRIGIARALYNSAEVIVFDEATSALDNVTEKEVMNAIESLSSKFTIILIAHRLSTLEKCDRIFELSSGRIFSEGDYQDLLSKSHP